MLKNIIQNFQLLSTLITKLLKIGKKEGKKKKKKEEEEVVNKRTGTHIYKYFDGGKIARRKRICRRYRTAHEVQEK